MPRLSSRPVGATPRRQLPLLIPGPVLLFVPCLFSSLCLPNVVDHCPALFRGCLHTLPVNSRTLCCVPLPQGLTWIACMIVGTIKQCRRTIGVVHAAGEVGESVLTREPFAWVPGIHCTAAHAVWLAIFHHEFAT